MKAFRQRKVPRALGGSWKAKSKKSAGEGPPSSAASVKQLGLSSDEERQMALLLGRLIQHLRQTGLRTPALFIRRAGASVETGRESGSEILESAAKQLCGSADSPADVLAVQDEHTWANVLKASLRELSHPLIPPHITEGLLAQDFDVEPVLPAVKQAVEDLPHKDYEVLRDLCELLRDCASDSERLTHVFGVILLEPPGSHSKPDSVTMIRQAKAITQIMRCLIVEAASVFGGAGPAAAEEPAQVETLAECLDTPPVASSADLSSDTEEDLDESGDPDRPAGAGADGLRSREVPALFDYEAIEDDELNLNAGDLVRIIEQIDTEWYLGQKICNDGTAETGIFPGAFCGLAGDEEFEPAEERDRIASAAFIAGDQGAGAPATRENVATEETPEDAIGYVKALFDFVATSDEELALREDQVVELLSDDDQSWWYGRADDGSTGIFPRSYVERCDVQPGAATLGSQTTEAVHAKLASHSAPPPPPPPPVRATSVDPGPVLPPAGSSGPPPGGPPPGGPPPKPPPRTTGVSRTVDSPRAAPAFRMPPAVPPPSLVSEPPRPSAVQTAQPVSSEWKMTRERYQLCCKFFNKLAVDVGGVRMVLGPAAAAFLEKSGLAKPVIARILELADIDGDCKLDRDEFVVAHHLTIAISKDGMPEPSSLPRYLIPKSKRKPTL